jgi:hypothetical protein
MFQNVMLGHMSGQKLKRTIKRVVDLETLTTITSDDLLQFTRDGYQRVRRAAPVARHKGETRFACDKCGHAVYAPLEPKTGLPYWRHYRGGPSDCPWWTGIPGTIDGIGGSQFNGAQESDLHHYLKNVLGELLRLDPYTEVESIIIDRYIVAEGGRRRPDVRAVNQRRRIAFEIQLATTPILTIVGREMFYEQRDFSLMWITWRFDPNERMCLRAGFEDIFYSHNKNIFSIDPETIQLSRDQRCFFFRVFWRDGGDWNSKVCSLRDLTWPDAGLPFVVAPWHLDFRQRWENLTTKDGTPYQEQCTFLAELGVRLKLSGEQLVAEGFGHLINYVLSCIRGSPIASREANLFALTNTFLYPASRHQYADCVRTGLRVTGNAHVLDRESVIQKFLAAETTPQAGPQTQVAVAAVFPEIFGERPNVIGR